MILAGLLLSASPPAPKPYRPDPVKVLAWADAEDVSWALMMACWEAERGVPGYEHGQRRISWEIQRLAPEMDWQVAQSARTIRKAFRAFAKIHAQSYGAWQGTDAEFQDRFASAFVGYLRDSGWQPHANPDQWGRAVLYWHHKLQGHEPRRGQTKMIR